MAPINNFSVYLILLLGLMNAACHAKDDAYSHTPTNKPLSFDEALNIWKNKDCIFPAQSWYKRNSNDLLEEDPAPKLEFCHGLENSSSSEQLFILTVCQAFYNMSIYLCQDKWQLFVENCLSPAALEKTVLFNDSTPENDVCSLVSEINSPLYSFMKGSDQCRKNCVGPAKDICRLHVAVMYQHKRSNACLPPPVTVNNTQISPTGQQTPTSTEAKYADTTPDKDKGVGTPLSRSENTSTLSLPKQEPPGKKDKKPITEAPIATAFKVNASIKPSSLADNQSGASDVNVTSKPNLLDKGWSDAPEVKIAELPSPLAVDQSGASDVLNAITTPNLIQPPPLAGVTRLKDLEIETSAQPSSFSQVALTQSSIILEAVKSTQHAEEAVELYTPSTSDSANLEESDNNDDDGGANKNDDGDEDFESDKENTDEDARKDEKQNNEEPKDTSSDKDKSISPPREYKTDEDDNAVNVQDAFEETENEKPLQGDVKVKGAHRVPSDEEDVPGSGHFLAYFLTAVVICISGYVIYHNKQKILAFVIEGRNNGRGGRQRSKEVKYTQLKSNVEEVLPSLEQSATSKNFVY